MNYELSENFSFPYEYKREEGCPIIRQRPSEDKMEKEQLYDIGSTLELLNGMTQAVVVAAPAATSEIVIENISHKDGSVEIVRDDVETAAVSEVISAVKTGDYEYLDTVAGNFDQYINRVMVTTFLHKVESVSAEDFFNEEETN